MKMLFKLFFITIILYGSSIFPQKQDIIVKCEYDSNRQDNSFIATSEAYLVAGTQNNEKAPFLVGNSNILFAIYEITAPGGLTKISVRRSTDNGISWAGWISYSGQIWSFKLPQAFIVDDLLYLIFDVESSSTNSDIYGVYINLSTNNSTTFIVENSENNTVRPSIIVDEEDIYVAFIDLTISKFIVKHSNDDGENFNVVYTSASSFTHPNEFLRVDGTNGSGSNMFVYNNRINDVDQIVVVNSSGTSWYERYISNSPGDKGSPSIGSYGNGWIVSCEVGNDIKYFWSINNFAIAEHTLTTNASLPTIDLTDSPSGFAVAVYIKDSKVYKKTSGVVQIPDWDNEEALYTDNILPSDDDFLGLWSSNSNAGVTFASEQASDNYDIYFSPLNEPSMGIDALTLTNKNVSEYFIANNYPNPFNPSTSIEFGIPEESINTLRIYDITGSLVQVLLENKTLTSGRFRYEFIAESLPSGVYIYVLTSSSIVSNKTFNSAKKMILLK